MIELSILIITLRIEKKRVQFTAIYISDANEPLYNLQWTIVGCNRYDSTTDKMLIIGDMNAS